MAHFEIDQEGAKQAFDLLGYNYDEILSWEIKSNSLRPERERNHLEITFIDSRKVEHYIDDVRLGELIQLMIGEVRPFLWLR